MTTVVWDVKTFALHIQSTVGTLFSVVNLVINSLLQSTGAGM